MRYGGPCWIHMMDRATPNMTYQAGRRDPKVEFFSSLCLISGVNFFLFLTVCDIMLAEMFDN